MQAASVGQFEGAAADGLHHAVGQFGGMVAGGVPRDDEELLATPAHQVVVVAEAVVQALRHLHQHRIAGGVAVFVVDLLEVVDVDHEEQQISLRRVAAFGVGGVVALQALRHVGLDVGGEVAPVAQAGERVGEAGFLQCLRLFTQCDRDILQFPRARGDVLLQLVLAPAQPARALMDQRVQQHEQQCQCSQPRPPGLPPGRIHAQWQRQQLISGLARARVAA